MKTKNTDTQSAWRFVKYALQFRPGKTPIHNYVLVRLANYADRKGLCFPSRAELVRVIGCGERTLDAALAYWKNAGVISWTRGWGNQHGQASNKFWFNEEAIRQLLAQEARETGEAEETANSAESANQEDADSAELPAYPAEVPATFAELPAKTDRASRNICALTSHGTSQMNVSSERLTTTSVGEVAAVASQNSLNELSLFQAQDRDAVRAEIERNDLAEQKALAPLAIVLRENDLSTKITSFQRGELLNLASAFGPEVLGFAVDRWLDGFDDIDEELRYFTDGASGSRTRRRYVLGEFMDGIGYSLCAEIAPFYEAGARKIIRYGLDICIPADKITSELDALIDSHPKYWDKLKLGNAVEYASRTNPDQPLHESLQQVWDVPEIMSYVNRRRSG